MNERTRVLAVAGTDGWIRHRLSRAVAGAGITVRDMGAGSAGLRGVDTLVLLPTMVPTSARSAVRDVGVGSAGVLFAATRADSVPHIVMLSRVHSADAPPGSYLGALATVERMAVNAGAKVTIVRVTHPFGDRSDPGPFVDALLHRRAKAEANGGDPVVEPVHVDTVVDVLVAAIDGRLSPGLREVGGPDRMPLSAFLAAAQAAGLDGHSSAKRRFRLFGGADPLADVLARDAVAASRYRPPVDVRRLSLADAWGPSSH
jgi:nucleoside-diphosphate-sugar epimerase